MLTRLSYQTQSVFDVWVLKLLDERLNSLYFLKLPKNLIRKLYRCESTSTPTRTVGTPSLDKSKILKVSGVRRVVTIIVVD
jgi:hypothetical protein